MKHSDLSPSQPSRLLPVPPTGQTEQKLADGGQGESVYAGQPPGAVSKAEKKEWGGWQIEKNQFDVAQEPTGHSPAAATDLPATRQCHLI